MNQIKHVKRFERDVRKALRPYMGKHAGGNGPAIQNAIRAAMERRSLKRGVPQISANPVYLGHKLVGIEIGVKLFW